MRIIAFGDIHMDTGALEGIKGIRSADYIVVTGDITNFGSRKDAERIIRRVRAINKNVLAVAGNLDQPDVARYLEETGISLHGRGRIINGLGFLGLGGSNYTPFNTPFEFSEKELTGLLEAGFSEVKKTEEQILVSHPPPFMTNVDKLTNGKHVGSTAVRRFIELRQPCLCLTGHIHESRGRDHIGRTHILNPGMLRDGSFIDIHIENGNISASLIS